MPPISRPLFDWSDDADEDASDDARAREDTADDAGDDDADDEAADGADDPDDVVAFDDEDDALLDDAFPLGDGVAEGAATVWCPYCGEPSEVAVDPGGGAHQAYVEDCPVCCRPWRVTVSYQPDGTADVWAQTDDE